MERRREGKDEVGTSKRSVPGGGRRNDPRSKKLELENGDGQRARRAATEGPGKGKCRKVWPSFSGKRKRPQRIRRRWAGGGGRMDAITFSATEGEEALYGSEKDWGGERKNKLDKVTDK